LKRDTGRQPAGSSRGKSASRTSSKTTAAASPKKKMPAIAPALREKARDTVIGSRMPGYLGKI
jgi:hypothetical protein